MPRYRTRSWRAFDGGSLVAGATVVGAVDGGARAGIKAGGASAPRPAEPRPPLAANLRILGLDPGSRKTGFGVIECRGPGLQARGHGCIAVAGLELAERLRQIFESCER